MREADVANTARTGGRFHWTAEEQRVLEEQWDRLCQALPDRRPAAIAQRLVKFEKGEL